MAKPIKEDIHTEFKSSFNDTVIESLSAFANTKGGRVLVGMTDNGMPVKGFTLGSETLQSFCITRHPRIRVICKYFTYKSDVLGI